MRRYATLSLVASLAGMACTIFSNRERAYVQSCGPGYAEDKILIKTRPVVEQFGGRPFRVRGAG